VVKNAADRVLGARCRPPEISVGYCLDECAQVIGRGAIEIRKTNVHVVAGEITVIDLDLDAQAQP
jgi:hypothetical protein